MSPLLKNCMRTLEHGDQDKRRILEFENQAIVAVIFDALIPERQGYHNLAKDR